MAGDFMVVNEFLVDDLKRLGLWNMDMLEKIKFYDGSIQQIDEIPPAIREKYKEVFEMEPQWLIKAAAYRGRWIDQSQSLNIFYGGTSGKVLSEIYQYAWSLGLKTTYYLRTMGASRIEKSTVNMAKFGATSTSKTRPSALPQLSSLKKPSPCCLSNRMKTRRLPRLTNQWQSGNFVFSSWRPARERFRNRSFRSRSDSISGRTGS